MSDVKSEVEEVRQMLQESAGEIPAVLSILPLDNFVLFPFMIAPIIVVDEAGRQLVDEAVHGQRIFGAFTRVPKTEAQQGETAVEAPASPFEQIPQVGTAAAILKMLRIPDGSIRLLVHGLSRIRIVERISEQSFLKARVEPLAEDVPQDPETIAMVKTRKACSRRSCAFRPCPTIWPWPPTISRLPENWPI